MSAHHAADRVATDVGGTFTDLVYLHTDPDTGRQEIVTAKADTTPPDFERGVLDVIAKSGVARGGHRLPRPRHDRRHQRADGAQGRHDRPDHHRGLPRLARDRARQPARLLQPLLRQAGAVRAAPPAARGAGPARADRAPSARRSTSTGCPRSSTTSAPRASRRSRSACCTPTPNPAHEQAVLERVRELWPEVSVVASHQITREWREYERTSTTVLSAYVQPVAERYLGRLHDGAGAATASRASSYIMQSNCGVDSLDHVKQIPITMVECGPASGFWGAAELGRLIGEPNVLALDIGGTTAKCSLIEGGHVRIMTDYWIERNRALGRLPDHGAGRRPRRDRQRRRQHRLGRRLRQAPRRPAVGRRATRARRRTGSAARTPRRPTPTSRSAASTRTTSAAASRRRHGRGRPGARRGRGEARRRRARRRRAASCGSPTTT